MRRGSFHFMEKAKKLRGSTIRGKRRYSGALIAFLCGLTLLGMDACKKSEKGVHDLQFDDAKRIYVDGMTITEVRARFGEPTTQMTSGGYVYWSYVPIHTRGKHLVGFEFQFHEGKSVSIKPVDMYSN